MTDTALACAVCSAQTEPDDKFCSECGAVVAAEQPVIAICGSCGESVLTGDSFCSGCGAGVAPDPGNGQGPEAVAQPGLDAVLSAPGKPFRLDSLLVAGGPFCRACGADHEPGAATCRACGVETVPLSPRLEGTLGTAYTIRKKMRKRPAVRIATREGTASLLLESGEVMEVSEEELPPAVELELPDGPATVRTPNGALLRLAEACRTGAAKYKWDPDVLVDTALDRVESVEAARLVALDALAVDRPDLLDRIDLTASERDWLRAVDATWKRRTAETFEAVVRLPIDGYRPKLSLLAIITGQAQSPDANAAAVVPHIAHYAGEEPIAGLLQRRLAAGEGPSATEIVEANGRLVDRAPIHPDLAVEIRAGVEAVAESRPELAGEPRFLGSNARAAIARLDPREDLIRGEDVGELPGPVLDDLIARGALARNVAIAGRVEPEVHRYLRARLAPETLTDDDLEALAHEDEIVRRAFRYGDGEALDQANQDSAVVKHYQSLLAVRRSRLEAIAVDDVYEADRPVVEALRSLVAAHADGAPVSGVLTERILADPTVWPILVEIAGPAGLDPTPDLREKFPRFTEWLALHQAREHLFLGAWADAVAAAERCLALAESEPVRDEALNLKACGLYNLGDEQGAASVLEEAIEGAYSDALLANIGIVAAGLRPEVAARYLGILIAEAPTVAMRAAAARRALDIWRMSDRESWQNSDDSALPDAFQGPLRDLLVADLELDDFRGFACQLAIHDPAWLSDARNIARSPHRDTLEAAFYVARADDVIHMIEVMGGAIARGDVPQWVFDERDSLRDVAVEILFESLDEPDSTFGSVALAMVDQKVLANRYDHLLLSALGTASVTYHLSQRQQEVADTLVDRLHAVRRGWQELDAQEKERLDPIVELATRRVAINRMLARDRELDEGVNAFNRAIDQGRYATPGTLAYSQALGQFQALAQLARQAREDLLPWLPIVDHADVRADLDKSVELTRDLERRCLEILG